MTIATIASRIRRLLFTGRLWAIVAVSVLAGVFFAGPPEAVYRAIALQHIATRVFDTPATTEASLLEGLRRFQRLVPFDRPTSIDDDPLSTLIRGFGACDSMAWAYLQLVERSSEGAHGRLLFLYTADGVSPHAVGEVLIDGKWRVIDVFYGRVFRTPGGELATQEDLARGQAVPQQVTNPATHDAIDELYAPELYANARVIYSSATQQLDWKRRALRDAARTFAGTGANLVQDWYLLRKPREYRIAPDTVWEDWSSPGSRTYFRARNYDLLGRIEAAAAAYRDASAQGSRYERESQLFLAALESATDTEAGSGCDSR